MTWPPATTRRSPARSPLSSRHWRVRVLTAATPCQPRHGEPLRNARLSAARQSARLGSVGLSTPVAHDGWAPASPGVTGVLDRSHDRPRAVLAWHRGYGGVS